MATGKSGTWQFNSTSAQSYLTMGAVKFIWEEEYDIASNTSTVKITSMQLLAGGDGYGNQNYGLGNLWFNGSVKINGVVAATLSRGYNSVYVVPAYNEFKECVAASPAYPWTVSNIAHDSDGSKSVDIVVDIFASTTNNNYKSNTNIKGSTSIALTTIPRSSSMSVSNGTLGTAQTISVTKSSDSFSHTITWACGTKSGTVCTKSTSTSISFTPSLDLATENTTGTSVSVTFTLQTYNGSTAIGSAVSKTVSMGIPSSVKPSCSISVSDPTGYSTTFGGYIQGKSKLAITVTPTLSYGSPISTYKTTANGSTYTSSSFTTGEISSSGSVSISSTVTDGRGRSGSATSTVTVIAYLAPSISYLSVNRCNADGTENQSGTYTKVTYSFAITSLSNKNSKTITLNYKKSSESSWTSVSLPSAYSATYATSIIPTDDGSSYDIQIVVQDYFEQITRTTSVSTAATIFHVHPSGNGFAFGKISEEEDCLDIGWSKLKLNGSYITGQSTSAVTSVAGKTGAVVLVKGDVGLGNVDNTADANKSVKYATSAGSAKASDVYAWAKASTKPTYTAAEVGARPSTWTPTAANVGAVSMKKLWTNSNHTAQFAPQTISLALTNYKAIMVVFKRHNASFSTTANDGNDMRSVIAIKNQSTMVNYKEGDYARRNFSFNNSGVTFLAGQLNGATNNFMMIPYEIYGIGGIT